MGAQATLWNIEKLEEIDVLVLLKFNRMVPQTYQMSYRAPLQVKGMYSTH